MDRSLLKNIFYGDEIAHAWGFIRWPKAVFPELNDEQISRIFSGVSGFFSEFRPGVFGGPITPGDAVMIATMMEIVKPKEMIEFGVASGLSSSFIFSYAKTMGLLTEHTFLHSVDLMEYHDPEKKVGSYLRSHFPEFDAIWDLHTQVTSATLLKGENKLALRHDGPVLAFVDGGHYHPWPILDILYLYETLPRETWVVLQDFQMMERWIADCVIHNVPSPAPLRGVNYAVTHWPGPKIIGFDAQYNSAVIQLDVTRAQMSEFVRACMRYPLEMQTGHEDLLKIPLRRRSQPVTAQPRLRAGFFFANP